MIKKRTLLSINILCSLLATTMNITIHAETLENEGVLHSTGEPSIPVKLSIPANPINVSLPTNVDLIFDGKDINAQVANNYRIINNSKVGNIQVSKIKTKIKEDGWTMNTSNSDTTYDRLPLDSKQLYVGFSKDGSTFQPMSEDGIDPGIMIGPSGIVNSQAFYLESKTGGVSTFVDSNLVDLEFTIGYQKEPIHKIAGLYDPETGVQTKSWDQLISDGDILLNLVSAPVTMLSDIDEETTPLRKTSSESKYRLEINNSANLVGEFIIDDSVSQLNGFYDCTNLISVTIPDSVTEIESMTFYGCTSLTTVKLPNSITSIGDAAFENTRLTEINMPTSLTSIGREAFYGCLIKSIIIPDSVKSIGDSAFQASLLESIVLPNSIDIIEGNMFLNCKNLKSVIIPNSVKKIDFSAFAECESLTSITIPDSVIEIGDNAFQDSTKLQTIQLPNSVTTIGQSAFSRCISLKDLMIPDTVTTIGEYAFNEVPHITYHGPATGSPWEAKSIN